MSLSVLRFLGTYNVFRANQTVIKLWFIANQIRVISIMNLVKKTFAVAFFAGALFANSAIAASEDHNAKTREAGETAIAKVEQAVALAEKGGDKAEILQLLADAKQAQKDFRYEQTERMRQKAGDKLKAAREEVETGNANAKESLKGVLAAYKEMMSVYLKAH